MLKDIHSETKPNGGSSMKDAINRIEGKMTAHQRALLDLRQEEAWFEANIDGDWCWINHACERALGIHRDDAAGRGWFSIVCTEDRDAVRTEWNHAVREYRTSDFMCRIKLPENKTLWIRILCTPIHFGKTPYGFVGRIFPQPG